MWKAQPACMFQCSQNNILEYFLDLDFDIT